MNEQELNKKLAEWAGFFYGHSRDALTLEPTQGWYYPSATSSACMGIELPNFTQSLDACFKWLVPKAILKFCQLFKVDIKDAYKYLFQWWIDERFKLNDVEVDALALCLAIEKLIDSQQE